MSNDRPQDVADAIDALGDTPTPDDVYHATREYDARYIASAAASEAKAGGGGGGGSQPITRAQYDLALADVPNGTPTKVPFAFNYGTELLDLSDTTNPTPAESGTYSFAVTVSISGVAEDGTWGVVVTLDENDFAGTMSSSEEITAATGSQTVTFPFYVPAGSPCFVKVDHSDTDGADFNGHVYVQRLS